MTPEEQGLEGTSTIGGNIKGLKLHFAAALVKCLASDTLLPW